MRESRRSIPTSDAEVNRRSESEVLAIPQRRIIDRAEWEDLEIDARELLVGNRLQLYEGIQGSKYLSVHFKGDRIVFTPTHYIGHIPLNDRLALNVSPRFNVSNLTRVLRIAAHSPVPLERFVRTYRRDRERLPTIFDELTLAFLQAVEVVLRNGLLPVYECVRSDGAFPKGRLLIGDTLRRHHARGTRFRATSSWYERTFDNGPNRLLKYTLWLLGKRLAAGTPRAGVAKLKTQLNRFYKVFGTVKLDRARRFLSDPLVLDPVRIPSVRAYYTQAVELAILLIRDQSLDLSRMGGPIRAPSMLVNLQAAFEAYLRNSLSDQLSGRTPKFDVLDGNLEKPAGARKGLFDESTVHAATPDIVIRYTDPDWGDDSAVAIIEVKYKGTVTREDLNQAIAYGSSYRSPIVVLAHVRTSNAPSQLRREGTIGNTVVYSYAYNLANDLEREEREFAQAIEMLIQGIQRRRVK